MVDVSGYLRRLGVTADAPTLETLFALHRAHAERVPYENLEIWLGRPTSVDPAESAARIIGGRGGYCFHLNGAFSALLRALGYRVTLHVGGVQGSGERPANTDGNHLVLTVQGLPGGEWLADLGMGDGLHEPLPLTSGKYVQGPFAYALSPSPAAPGGWRFDHDPRGSFLGMDFRAEAAAIGDFAAKHTELQTSPESGFVRTLTVQRRDATGVDVLRGLELTRNGTESSRATLETAGDYFTVLADIFGLTLDSTEREILWPRLLTAHERWLSATQAADI